MLNSQCRAQRSNQSSAVKATLRPVSRAKEDDDRARPRGNDTSESHAGKWQAPRSELPTLGARVSSVGGADSTSAPETRRRVGCSAVRVSLRRGHIDPGVVSSFNGTWQIR